MIFLSTHHLLRLGWVKWSGWQLILENTSMSVLLDLVPASGECRRIVSVLAAVLT